MFLMSLKEPQDPLNIIITPLSRIPPFVALLVDVMAQTFFPPFKCHWFLVDIGRMIAEATRDFFDHCLTPMCCTTSTIRARSLLNIVLSTRSLRLASEYRGVLGSLPETLLRARLNAGADWDIVDASLADVFKKRENPSISKSLVNIVIQKLQKNNFEPADTKVKVYSSCMVWSMLKL